MMLDGRERDTSHANAKSGATFVELLQTHAQWQADRRCLTFLADGEGVADHLSYGELDLRARAIAARLQQEQATGRRVLLVFPPGLDYISAFFGCLYAGAVAVPVYPPRRNRSLERIRAIVADAQPRFALTLAAQTADLQHWAAEDATFADVGWLASDAISADTADLWRDPAVGPQSLAFLQYTSGSTGTPRGVMVSHANLLANER